MSVIPSVEPRSVEPTDGVAWPTTAWPRGEHVHQGELDAVVDEMFTLEELSLTNAVVVVQHGRVLCERYAGVKEYFDRPPEVVDATTTLLSWSMAKSISHMIIGTLVDAHRLNPDQPAPVLEWRNPRDPRHQIRLRDLLAMRDGLDFNELYALDRESHVVEMLFGAGKDDVGAYAAARPLARPPGTHFSYSSGSSNILSRIVADTVGYGDAYRDYLGEKLFTPLGMTSAEATFDASGVFVASTFVHATALDFAKFGLLYLRGGQWDGEQLISPAWVDTAQRPISREEESGNYYSWQWWVSGDEYGTYWASGHEGQRISVVPALDALVLRFGHTPEERYPALQQWRHRLLEVLAKG